MQLDFVFYVSLHIIALHSLKNHKNIICPIFGWSNGLSLAWSFPNTTLIYIPAAFSNTTTPKKPVRKRKKKTQTYSY